MNASSRNSLDIVNFLQAHVKDINIKNKKGQSALTLAFNRNTVEVVDFLIQNNADVSVIDSDQNSLAYYLMNTYRNGNTKAFEAKLDILKSNNSGENTRTSCHMTEQTTES